MGLGGGIVAKKQGRTSHDPRVVGNKLLRGMWVPVVFTRAAAAGSSGSSGGGGSSALPAPTTHSIPPPSSPHPERNATPCRGARVVSQAKQAVRWLLRARTRSVGRTREAFRNRSVSRSAASPAAWLKYLYDCR